VNKKGFSFSKIKRGLFGNKPLLFILLLAAFLRLYRISSYMEFLGDQGRDVLIVHRFLTKGDLMFIGPQTSIGNMYLGPWYYYLMAPALLLAGLSPVGPAIMVALLGVLTVWLTFRVGKEWFDKKTGLIAAVLMAFSPIVIAYSNFSWNPNIMSFFALLSIWFLYRVWQKKEFRFLPWLAASLAMALNSHYLGLLLFPIAGIFFLLSFWEARKDKKQIKKFIASLILAGVVFLVFMLPLILFDFKHDLANFQAFKTFFLVRQTTVSLKAYKGIGRFWEISNQVLANLFTRKDKWIFSSSVFTFLTVGAVFLRKNKAFWLISTWVLLGLLGLGNYKQHIYAHYFGFLWPALILWFAAALKILRKFSWLFLTGLLIIMLSHWHGWKSPNYQVKRARLGAESICEQVKKNSLTDYNVVNLASYNDFRAMSYRYFLVKECSSLPLGFYQYPEAKNLMVVAEDQKKYPDPLGADIWEIQVSGNWQIAGSWEAFDTTFYHLSKKPLSQKDEI